ncbi:MAG: cyclic nucleotide-binding domain-containing protein [Candidatus Goldbacteria bacterium]|nr:cyclic nucleotide-binding domain-containing protein [Candidatus Goldiibacteriota bacterium]
MADPVEYEMLKEAALFKTLTDAELDIVAKKVFLKPYKKGSTLFVEGMPGEVLYVVVEGGIDIIKKTKEGDKVIANLGKGEIVGEMSIIDSGARTASGKTGEDSKLIVVTKNSFSEILDSDPAIAAKILMALLRIINRRLRVTDKKFEQ